MTKNFLRKTTIMFLVILAMFQLTGCSGTTETVDVTAEVTSKEYVESHLDYGYHFDAWKGKFRWKFKNMPAEYNVTIQYEDIITTFDSKSLYDSYKVGDKIEVYLTTYYDSEGVAYNRFISRRN